MAEEQKSHSSFRTAILAEEHKLRSLKKKAKRESFCKENSIKTFKKRIIGGCWKKIEIREGKRIEGRLKERIYEIYSVLTTAFC